MIFRIALLVKQLKCHPDLNVLLPLASICLASCMSNTVSYISDMTLFPR